MHDKANGTSVRRGNRKVRLLLLGDEGVGKTSLILSLVSEQFPQNVPARVEQIVIPADVCPERVPTVLVDFSSREQSDDDADGEIVRADVIALVYSLVDERSKQRVSSYWLPRMRSLLGRSHRTPIVLVGNKSDLVADSIEGQSLESAVPVMNDFNEVETVIECSALTMKNLAEMFYYAQKAVLHPFSPLYDIETGRLSDRCVRCLSRIFKIADTDGDGVWNEAEMQEFQQRVFQAPLLPHALDDVKSIVAKNEPTGLRNDCLTLNGFLFLNLLFVQRGRHEATWTTLRAFGYDDTLELLATYRVPPEAAGIGDGIVVELSDHGLMWLLWLFSKYDADKDDLLSPSEFYNLLSTCPKIPFGADVFNSIETAENGYVTRSGFQALWALVTHSNAELTMECLAYFGYQWHMQEKNQLSAFKFSRNRPEDMQLQEMTRSVLFCNVVGAQGSGKTLFLQALLGRTRAFVEQNLDPELMPQYAAHPIHVYGARRFLLLHEVKAGSLEPRELKCDATCFLFDPASADSLEYAISFYQRYQSHFDRHKVPCLFVASHADVDRHGSTADSVDAVIKIANQLIRREVLPPLENFAAPVHFGGHAIGSDRKSDLFVKLATLACYPNLKPLLKVLLLRGGQLAAPWWPFLSDVDTPAEQVKQCAIVGGSVALLLVGGWMLYQVALSKPRRTTV